MLKNQLRRDLRWLKRQARRDRRVAVTLLTGLAAAWARQLSAPLAGDGVLLVLSLGLMAASGVGWGAAAFFLGRAGREQAEPVEALRWVARNQRAREWACCSLGAYVAWHTLQFASALVGPA